MNFEGATVTWGFSSKINLWNCRTSLVRPFIGSYDPSQERVLFCRICCKVACCVSYYESHILRVWDFRTLETIQVIQVGSLLSHISSLFVLNNDDFLLANKEIHLFRNDEKQISIVKKLSHVSPFKVAFNEYHKTIVCGAG